MEKMSGKKLIGFLAVMVCLLGLMALGMLWQEKENTEVSETEFAVSLDSGFYGKNQEIRVSVPKGAEVYYTDNGENPTKENGILYDKPISLTAYEEEEVSVYRFQAFFQDGSKSQVLTRTYFLGKNIASRYDMKVLHLTGEPEGLFGYENGIFVKGIRWDEFWKEHPDTHIGSHTIEANYNQRGPESEREVYIQFFEPDGTEILSQNGGVRIVGSATRIKNQKSFRLYARKEYDEKNEFDYAFLRDLVSEVDGTVAEKHKRLIVRNAGTDNGYAFLRSEMVGKLASEAGFPDVMYAVPVCVYINGGYYGVYWLENNYDGQYFENRYGEYTGEFIILEGGDKKKDDEEDSTVQEYVEDYNQQYEKFAAMDLTDDNNYQELCEFMDVENYLQYFAIENYVANMDWPDNNLKVYRYVSDSGEYEPGSVFDGRYRFLLYDVDYGFGLLTFNDTIGFYSETPTLDYLMQEKAPLFAALMKRDDCVKYFINYTCDLMNGAMGEKNVISTVDEMHAARYAELYHMLEETDLMKDSAWESEESLHMDTVELNLNRIKGFSSARPRAVQEHIANHFAYEETYKLQVEKGQIYSGIQLNSLYLEEPSFSGTYFSQAEVRLEPCMTANETFAYWLVNGAKRETEILTLKAEDVTEGRIEVQLVINPVENPVLQLKSVKAKGGSDYVEIINLSGETVSTRGYFLSDSEDYYQYALPVMSLKPGEIKRIYGKDCNDVEGIGQLGMNFNLKQGETVTLSYFEEVIDSVTLPKLSEDGVYTRDFLRNRYVEQFP